MVMVTKESVLDSEKFIKTRVKFNELKALFREVASQNMTDKTRQETGILKPSMEYKCRKQEMTPQKAAQVMGRAKKIVIFTGDVINSYARFNKRFDKEDESTTQLFIKKNFVFKPEKMWKWVDEFKQEVENLEPTQIHDEITNILGYIHDINSTSKKASQVQTMLVTSSIDGLQARSIAKSAYADKIKVCEIDGCIDRMHCTREHSNVMLPTKISYGEDGEEVKHEEGEDMLPIVPKCPECGFNVRPNIRYRDEADDEDAFQSETVNDFIKDADCMVMIGQAMITVQAKRLVGEMLNREMPVIEINPVCLVNRGNNIQVKGPMHESVQTLFEQYKKIKN